MNQIPMQISRKFSRESIGREPKNQIPMQISRKFSRESIGKRARESNPDAIVLNCRNEKDRFPVSANGYCHCQEHPKAISCVYCMGSITMSCHNSR